MTRHPVSRWLFVFAVSLLTHVHSVHAQTAWTNTSTDFSWNTSANWSAGVPTSGVLATFSNAGAGTMTLDANQSVLGLSFTNTTEEVINSGTGTNTLTIFGSGIASSTAGAVTINADIALGAAQSWAFTNAGGTLTTGNVNLSGFGLTIGATNVGVVTIGGVLSGAGGVIVNGGTLTLTSANNYTGTTTVTAGTLKLGANGALPTTTTLAFPVATAGTTVTCNLQGFAQTLTNLTFANTANATVNFTGTAGSALTLSPATLTIAPSSSLVNFNLTLSLASLGAFTYNNPTGTVNLNNGPSSSAAANAVTLTFSSTTNTITAATLNLGTGGSGGGVVNTNINLGASNTFAVNTIRFANGRTGAVVKFAAGLTNPVLNITGAAGGASLTTFNLGQGRDSNTTSTTPSDTFDTTLGTLNGQFSTITIAQHTPAITANRTIVYNENFLMGAGSITAITMNLVTVANHSSSVTFTVNTVSTGIFSITGGTASIGTITMSNSAYTDILTGTNTMTATINLNTGATLNATTIQNGTIATPSAGTITATNRLNWNDGTIGNRSGTDLTLNGPGVVLAGAAANHTFNISGGQTGTVSSIISGTGPITKAGTGTLVFTAANTYTGATTITSGTLQLAGGTLGAANNPLTLAGGILDLGGFNPTVSVLSGTTGAIVNNTGSSVLTFGTAANSSFAAALSDGIGTLGITKSGGGTMTLSGTNTYSGPTTVTAGKLVFNSTPPTGTSIKVAAGGTLTLSNGVGNQLTSLAGLDLGAGTSGNAVLNLQLGSLINSDKLQTSSAAVTANNIVFNLTALPGFGVNDYTLLAAAGGLTSGGAVYSYGSVPVGNFGYSLNVSDTSVILHVISIAATTGPVYWTGNTDAKWSTISNSNAVNFATTVAGTTPMTGSPNLANTVVFSSTAVSVGSPTTATTLDGNFAINDLIFNNRTNGGTITAITIDPGTVATNTLMLSPSSAAVGITVDPGAPASITISAPVVLGADQTWTVTDAGTTLTASGSLAGTFALTKAGLGTLVLTDLGLNFSGNLQLNGGTVNLNSATVDSTISGVISGFGVLVKSGAATLTLSGNNTYSGGTQLTAGTLIVNHAAALGTGTVTITGGGFDNTSGSTIALANNNLQVWNGDFSFTGTNALNLGTGAVTLGGDRTVTVAASTLTVGGVIGGNFGLTKAGAGTMVLSAANTYTGSTAITGGILSVTSLVIGGIPSNIGASTATTNNLILNGGTLRYAGTTPGVTDRLFTLGTSGELRSDSTPAVNSLTFNNTGTIVFVTPDTPGLLTLSGSNSGTNLFAASLGNNGAGAISLTKAGTANWTLAGTYSYTGATIIEAGTLKFTTDQAAPLGGLTIGIANAATVVGTLDLSTASATFTAGLVRTNTATPNIITVGSGKTLSLTGGLTLGYDAGSGSATNTRLTINGPGSVSISGTTIAISVNQAGNAVTWNNTGTFNVATLSNFTVNLTGAFNIGVGTSTAGHGTVTLSNTANDIQAATLTVGNTGSQNGSGTSTLILGTGTNLLKVTTLNIGLGKSSGPGILNFASQAANSPGTVTISDTTGSGAATLIDVANVNGVGTAGGAIGTFDLRGHVSTVNATTLRIGNNNMGSNTGNTTGTVSFDTGTFTVDTLNMAPKTAVGTGTANAILNIGGGTFTVNTAFTFGSQATAGASAPTLTITGGTFLSNTDIAPGAGAVTSTINLIGGTLDLTGHAIGPVNPVTNLNFQVGTLQNVQQINAGSNGFTKNTTGTLTLAGTNSFSGSMFVTSGTLSVTGNSTAATGQVFVSGGTLRGNGSLGGAVNLASGTIRGGNSGGTLTIAGGLSISSGASIYVEIFNGSTPAVLSTGGSTLGPLPNPSSNNFLEITGGNSLIDPGTAVTIDATTVPFVGGTYSYRIARGLGDQSALNITDPTLFTFVGFGTTPTNVSLTGDLSGSLYVNFTATAAVPEPAALLALAFTGLFVGRRFVAR